jgi:succinate dehydrogenase / fumarate reductase cytochrome b subunit
LLFRYRGREGMLAWAFHRLSGLAIWLFVVVHIIDIYLAGDDPKAYDTILQVYASPPGRIGEVLLGAALLYHALNGLRIVVMDFWPRLTHYQRGLWWACWIIFFGLGLPGAFIILRPIFGAR